MEVRLNQTKPVFPKPQVEKQLGDAEANPQAHQLRRPIKLR